MKVNQSQIKMLMSRNLCSADDWMKPDKKITLMTQRSLLNVEYIYAKIQIWVQTQTRTKNLKSLRDQKTRSEKCTLFRLPQHWAPRAQRGQNLEKEEENYFKRVCPFCNKQFIRASHAKLHIKYEHEGAKYKCDFCEKAFCSPHNFHMLLTITTAGSVHVFHHSTW